MFRMTRIVPATVLTAAALALAAPVAQAKPLMDQSGGTTSSVQRVHRDAGAAAVNGLQRVHRDAGAVVVTTGDKPLANPVQLPENLSVGLMHASTVHVPVDKIPSTPVSTPDSGNGFDWTAAAIGACLGGILMLMLAGGFGLRRRGQLAA